MKGLRLQPAQQACLKVTSGHSVTRSLSRSVTLSLGHSVTWSLHQLVTRSLGHLVIRSLGHSIISDHFRNSYFCWSFQSDQPT